MARWLLWRAVRETGRNRGGGGEGAALPARWCGVLAAFVTSAVLSSCLVSPPECERCSHSATTHDAGSSDPEGQGPTSDVEPSGASSTPSCARHTEPSPSPSVSTEPTSDVASDSGSATDGDATSWANDVDTSTADARRTSTDDVSRSGEWAGSSSFGEEPTTEGAVTEGAVTEEGAVTSDSATTGAGTSDTETAGTSTEPPIDGEGWTEGFEDGWGGWTTQGAWQIGESNGATPAAQAGQRLVGTGFEGPYVRQNSRLRSPRFVVPRATDQPRLRYWYWYELEPGDSVQIQVRVGDETSWVDFKTVTDTISTVAGRGKRWMQGMLPLYEFAEQEIQLSFALTASGETCSVPGFFVDSISLEIGPMDVCSCAGFDDMSGAGDWSIEGGQWGIGQGSNPDGPAPQAGAGLAGTNLFGAYESLAAAPAARLTSPSYWVNGASHSVDFYYWHAFSVGGRGKVQVRVVGEPWQDLPPFEFTGTSAGGWVKETISLDPWVGQDIQFGFLMENGAGVGDAPTTAGFYVDQFAFR